MSEIKQQINNWLEYMQNNFDSVSDNDIIEIDQLITNHHANKEYLADLFRLADFLGQYLINIADPISAKQYMEKYLEFYTGLETCKIYLKRILGAALTDIYERNNDFQFLLDAELLFKEVIDSNLMSGKFLREAKRNLCNNIISQRNPNKIYELLNFSYFYDVSIYLNKCNQVGNRKMFCEHQFMKMLKNDYACPIDEFYDNTIPDKLYKYRTITDYNMDLIENSTLYLTDAESFNDPFDPPFRVNEEYRKYMKILAPMVVIGSLSNINNSILMWSHYADSHKGFCIEYDITEFKRKLPKYTTIRKVRYSETLSISSGKPMDTDEYFHSILDMYAFKHKDWEYEEEYRIFSHQESDFLSLPISRIYLGKDIIQENESKIRNICQNKKILVDKMHVNNNDIFKLEF